MKKLYVFSLFIVLVSAVLLVGCGKQYNIYANMDSPEYYINIREANKDDIISCENNSFKVKAGKTVDIYVNFKEGWDPLKAKLFANGTELTLSKSDLFEGDSAVFAQVKVESDLTLEVKNLVKIVYTAKLPTQNRSEYLIFNQQGARLTGDSVSVSHGDDLTLTVVSSSSAYMLPNFLVYDIGDSFDLEGYEHLSIHAITDLHGHLAYSRSGSALSYKFSDVTTNFAIEFFQKGYSNQKFVNLNLANNSEYVLSSKLYKEKEGEETTFEHVEHYGENVYGQDLYIYIDLLKGESPVSYYVKNLENPTIVVEGKNESWEYPLDKEGVHNGYFCIPKAKVESDLTIYLKDKAIDDSNLETGKFYGTFDNQVAQNIPDKLVFTKGYLGGRESYTYKGKVYLTKGDTLFIDPIYGDSFIIETTGITLKKELINIGSQESDPKHIKYTVESIEYNNFSITLTSSVKVKLPYAELKENYKVEYLLGSDPSAAYTEMTSEEASEIMITNHQALIIRLTDLNDIGWENFDLSEEAAKLSGGTYNLQNYLYCKTESGVGRLEIYPDNGIYHYVINWFIADTIITNR